jgi:hypothetical protein
MKLNEIMNRPYQYSIKKLGHDEIRGNFKTDDNVKYEVGFFNVFDMSSSLHKAYEISFSNTDAYMKGMGKTETGNEFRVFATVFDMVKKVVKEENPISLYFTAKEINRQSLYKKMIQKFAKSINFTLKRIYIREEIMKLHEVLDKPYQYKWTQKSGDNWYGSFEISDGEAVLVMFQDPVNYDPIQTIEIVFSRGKPSGYQHSTQLTNTGNQFKIFATVMMMAKEYIKKNSPEKIIFTAKEKSRQGLYGKLIKKFAGQLGYKLVNSADSYYGVEYNLMRI